MLVRLNIAFAPDVTELTVARVLDMLGEDADAMDAGGRVFAVGTMPKMAGERLAARLRSSSSILEVTLAY